MVQWPVGAQFQMVTGFVPNCQPWSGNLVGGEAAWNSIYRKRIFPFFSPSYFPPPSLFFKGYNNRTEFVLETGICPSVTGSCWYVFLGSHGNVCSPVWRLAVLSFEGFSAKTEKPFSPVYQWRFPALCAGAGLLLRARQWGLRGLLWQRWWRALLMERSPVFSRARLHSSCRCLFFLTRYDLERSGRSPERHERNPLLWYGLSQEFTLNPVCLWPSVQTMHSA